MIRADTIRHSANRGKVERVGGFVRRYRDCAAAISASEWRSFFETGRTSGKYANVSRFNTYCGAAPAQMAYAQVRAMLGSFLANRQNDFRAMVNHSSLPDRTKHMLHTINAGQAWYRKDEVTVAETGETVPPDIRHLARVIMRAVFKRHRKPNARGIAPVLDVRCARLSTPLKARSGDLWATFKFVGEKAFAIPLHTHAYWQGRQGKRCNVIQIVPDGRTFGVRLMTDMSEPFAQSRAAYTPRCARIGLDFGLSTLIATDCGDLMGRGFLDTMRRIDRQIVGIVRHRMRAGGKPGDSRRYRALIRRVRGIIKTRINSALNRIVAIHAPGELVVERLDLHIPGLSRRLNRILTNCGRAVFKTKLADLNDKFGIKTADINPAYTSQECSRCGFVSRDNRKSQSQFRCLHCGHAANADVDAAKVIARRRSSGLDLRFATRRQVLAELQRRFGERQGRSMTAIRGTQASSRQPQPPSFPKAAVRGNEAFTWKSIIANLCVDMCVLILAYSAIRVYVFVHRAEQPEDRQAPSSRGLGAGFGQGLAPQDPQGNGDDHRSAPEEGFAAGHRQGDCRCGGVVRSKAK